MTTKKLLFGREALRLSVSERVGASLSCPESSKKYQYGVLVPSDSGECIFFGKVAPKYAERLKIKFMIFMDKTVADSASTVFEKELPQLPGATDIRSFAENCPFNKVINNRSSVGIIAFGDAYNSAREVYCDNADYLKLGMIYPISSAVLRDFASAHESIIVLDNCGVVEERLDALGISYMGSGVLGKTYDHETLRLMLFGEEADFTEIADEVPER